MMPAAEQLLKLFPRAWRERYGDEFVAMLGPEPLRAMQVIDVVMSALDARLSPEVRRAAHAGQATSDGGTMRLQSLLACQRGRSAVTPRDGLIGAAVMLTIAAVCSAVAAEARRNGWPIAADTVKSLSFSFAFLLSMPFWLMKGQPWKAQAAIIGVTLAVLAGIARF